MPYPRTFSAQCRRFGSEIDGGKGWWFEKTAAGCWLAENSARTKVIKTQDNWYEECSRLGDDSVFTIQALNPTLVFSLDGPGRCGTTAVHSGGNVRASLAPCIDNGGLRIVREES